MKILVTGSAGFVGGYLVKDLLEEGMEVVGIDNYSKYGPVSKSYDSHPNYKFLEGDAKDVQLLSELVDDCDYMVCLAAMIGGISYFHEYAYDLLAENERIMASSFDAAIDAYKNHKLKRIVIVSSSMVFENATEFPTSEQHIESCPPPFSTYGFQKLSCEYFAKGALTQHGLPYTICRPFNCVGVGEQRALQDKQIMSGDIKMAMSHVVPDLVQKILKGQNPLHILGDGNQVRHYTYGGDLSKGIRTCMDHPKAENEAFNLSIGTPTTVLGLAEMIWQKINENVPFSYVSDEPYPYDVQHRSPNVDKARNILGYEAATPLDKALDEVIPWIKMAIEKNMI